jgi:hypothetical protein
MKGVKSKRFIPLKRDEVRLSANDSNGYRVDCECDVIKNEKTGEISIRLNLPHFEEVSLPDDLGLLLRTIGLVVNSCCFAAGLYGIGERIKTLDHINKIEYDMILAGILDREF